MKASYQHALHIFRRDLRLVDNTALSVASSAALVSVGFIFDPIQVGTNAYKSIPALKFMLESLDDLAREVQMYSGVLNFWFGSPADVLDAVLAHSTIDAVMINADYTPFSRERDAALAAVCKKRGVAFIMCHDALLTEPGSVLTSAGKPFKIFTPFYKAAAALPVAVPEGKISLHLSSAVLCDAHQTIPVAIRSQCAGLRGVYINGGRQKGVQLLKALADLDSYAKRRDIPSDEKGTSHLSAHNKFGTVSIREVYHALHSTLGIRSEPLVRSLYWRDFFAHVLVSKPSVLGHPYQDHYERLAWDNDEEKFARWCAGATGFPLIDAGMRQLNETGYMHNRVRMVVASFLVKDLHIDWRWGERYFAQHLVDYDPAVNNGNWQWCASTGCDAQPYFRIFNPWLQQKKFDPDAIYIKRWVSELSQFTSVVIHAAAKKPIPGYSRPMVDHAIEAKKALLYYKRLNQD